MAANATTTEEKILESAEKDQKKRANGTRHATVDKLQSGGLRSLGGKLAGAAQT